jgi:PAS domain S-box-containing protein
METNIMDTVQHKILLVEDNTLDQMAFKRFMQNNALPYDCTISASVSEAKEALRANHFDIIIADHSLGDGTALDILEAAQDTPVIVVTGAGDEETAVRAWKAGAYDYLIKDINQNYLKAIPITVENTVRHKMVEEKLQLLSGAVMSTEDSVYITDMDGDIIFVNKAFCTTYGYTEEEIVGENGNILWIGRGQSKNTRSVFQTKAAGSSWEVGFYHRRKDDSIFPVSLSRSHIRDSHGNAVAIVGVARDITDRMLVEDEMRTASLKLKKRNRLQSKIAVMVGETVQRLLADGNVTAARKVLGDYLDISRIEADEMELRRQEFELAPLISLAVEAAQPLATERNVHLENLTPACELAVNADRDKISRVLTALLGRAIDSSVPGSRVSVTVTDTDKELSVQVRDDGRPLECNEIHRIMNHCDWIKEQSGAGKGELALGLRVAKELIELHGGRMWAESSDTGQNANVLGFTVPKTAVQHPQEVPAEILT